MEQEEAKNSDTEQKKDDSEEKNNKVEEIVKEEQADKEMKTNDDMKGEFQKGVEEVEQKATEEKQDNEEDSYELIVNTEEVSNPNKAFQTAFHLLTCWRRDFEKNIERIFIFRLSTTRRAIFLWRITTNWIMRQKNQRN